MNRKRLILSLTASILLLNLATARALDHEGPHKGMLFAAKDEKHHCELVVDAKTKSATAYILDGTAKKPVKIKATTIELWAKGHDKPIVFKAKLSKAADNDEFTASDAAFGGKIEHDNLKFKIVRTPGKDAEEFGPDKD